MSVAKTLEDQCLTRARFILHEQSCSLFGEFSNSARLDILEALASILGGFRLRKYWSRLKSNPVLSEKQALVSAEKLLPHLAPLPMHSALALSALASPALDHSEQRTAGAYHTDFRLAMYVAESLRPRICKSARIVDPACGTGILLVAATLIALQRDDTDIADWLGSSVFAADLSQESLRGARLALASLTDNVDALGEMASHWFCGDILLCGSDQPAFQLACGFDVVLGNPPWEKVKVTRHEYLQANGQERHYGAEYRDLDQNSYLRHRNKRYGYAQELMSRYPLMGTGEPDLYKPFLELSFRLVRDNGRIGILVPAGLIRSQGTEELRRFLFSAAKDVEIAVFENRARFFAIDTRFKFLALSATRKANTNLAVGSGVAKVYHGSGTHVGVNVNSGVQIDFDSLSRVRPDLTVPEVRSAEEWDLFRSFATGGVPWNLPDSEWFPEIVREIDMTRDSSYFVDSPAPEALPLIEGRMIHQYRFGCKGYRSGTGRRAKWETFAIGSSSVEPQFWFPIRKMSEAVRQRSDFFRAGFCDITGQTNERSMLAALITPGVVCGNKVPTVTFVNDPSIERLDLWVAIVNSLPFDWMLRRIITTTVNYFLLLSVPLPRIAKESAVGRRITRCSRELRELDRKSPRVEKWKVAELKAEIDVAVLVAYGGTLQDMHTILQDYPLFDRGQPPLPGERQSTITRDFVLWRTSKEMAVQAASDLQQRVTAAKRGGACPYVPAEFQNRILSGSEELCHG